ncbi:glutaredoxin 3 [Marinobacterium aestuariivivens]|uniref:Glutaredoxin n=1 Tax=Marinobacterium aestuariivivens TaxID=1698799 RepID=A0ABW2A137_9GAMM
MSDILIYTTTWCPYCVRAKMLLDHKALEYREINLDQEPAKRLEMMERSGRRTVPQIFIGDTHVGGCDELYALERQGDLDDLLAKA